MVFNYGTSKAKHVTLSFWIKSNKACDISVNFENEQNPDRGYQVKQTINNVDTWEKKIVTIPGDTARTLTTGSQKAFCFDIFLSAPGSTGFTGGTPSESWTDLNNNQRGVHCNADFYDSTSNYFKVTGVQLELGKNATEFEHRSYGEELALCQRYFFILSNSRLVGGYKRHDNFTSFNLDFPVPMRGAPTVTLSVSGTFTNFQTNFNTTQSSPNIYEWNAVSGNRAIFRVDSNWGSTHAFIPSWEGFTAEFSAEI